MDFWRLSLQYCPFHTSSLLPFLFCITFDLHLFTFFMLSKSFPPYFPPLLWWHWVKSWPFKFHSLYIVCSLYFPLFFIPSYLILLISYHPDVFYLSKMDQTYLTGPLHLSWHFPQLSQKPFLYQRFLCCNWQSNWPSVSVSIWCYDYCYLLTNTHLPLISLFSGYASFTVGNRCTTIGSQTWFKLMDRLLW